MIFRNSHIGVVDTDIDTDIFTIEAYTGPGKTVNRDGDGCWEKVRNYSQARSFIRLMD